MLERLTRRYALFAVIALMLPGSLFASKTDSLVALLEQSSDPVQRGLIEYELAGQYESNYSFDTALTLYHNALMVARDFKNDSLERKTLWHIGYIHYQLYSYDKAIEFFYDLVKIHEENGNDSLKASALDWLSLQYLYSGAYQEAIHYQLESISIRENINDSAGLAESYYSMGDIFSHQRKYEQSFEYFNKCIEYASKYDMQHLVFGAYASIGSLYIEEEKWDSAFEFHSKALRLATEVDMSYGIAYSSAGLGEYYLHMEMWDSAAVQFERSLDLSVAMQEYGEHANSLMGLGRVAHETGNFPKALKLFDSAYVLSEMHELYDVQEEILKRSAECYYDFGLFDSAYHHQQLLLALKDSLFAERNASMVSSLEARYDVLSNEARQKEVLLAKENQIQQMSFWGAVIFLLLVSALLWTLYRNMKATEANNRLLEANNLKIQEQNAKLTVYNEDLKQFAYATSHDLKQPLRTIGSFANLLKRKLINQFDKDSNEYFRYIEQAVTDMSSLLTNLLHYTQLDNKSPSYEVLNLNEVMSSVTNNLAQLIREKEANVLIEHLPEIYANREHLLQLFQNMINNGLKFNDKDKPEIVVSWSKIDESYCFSVRDNGVGFDPEYREKVFQPFQRLHDPSEYQGTGMGLAISKRIVKHYQGEIWVESTPGEGSCFYFTIPTVMAEQMAA